MIEHAILSALNPESAVNKPRSAPRLPIDWSLSSRWMSWEEIEEEDAGQQSLDLEVQKPWRFSEIPFSVRIVMCGGVPHGIVDTYGGRAIRQIAPISPVKLFSDRPRL